MLQHEIHEADDIDRLHRAIGHPLFQLAPDHRCAVIEHPGLEVRLLEALHLNHDFTAVFRDGNDVHQDGFLVPVQSLRLRVNGPDCLDSFREKVIQEDD